MYEDPNVTECFVTVVLTFASDEAHEAKIGAEIAREVQILAEHLGVDAEVQFGNLQRV